MDAPALRRRLEATPDIVRSLVPRLTDAEARWKPPSGAWSVLEVLRHLIDEEVEDFRARLRGVLEGTPLSSIDPVGWATSRRYNEADVRESVVRFARERAASLAWLDSLPSPDWTRAGRTPGGFDLRAGDLLAAWAAHDALHVRQIAKRLFELAARDAGGFQTTYAGTWGA